MPDIMPVSLQNIMHGGQPKLRKEVKCLHNWLLPIYDEVKDEGEKCSYAAFHFFIVISGFACIIYADVINLILLL